MPIFLVAFYQAVLVRVFGLLKTVVLSIFRRPARWLASIAVVLLSFIILSRAGCMGQVLENVFEQEAQLLRKVLQIEKDIINNFMDMEKDLLIDVIETEKEILDGLIKSEKDVLDDTLHMGEDAIHGVEHFVGDAIHSVSDIVHIVDDTEEDVGPTLLDKETQ